MKGDNIVSVVTPRNIMGLGLQSAGLREAGITIEGAIQGVSARHAPVENATLQVKGGRSGYVSKNTGQLLVVKNESGEAFR